MTGTKDTKDTPYALRPGDVVAAILPAGPPDIDRFNAGIGFLEAAGFRVQRQAGAELRKQRYLAGSDQARADEFAKAYQDPNVRALWIGRGGYGSMRLFSALQPVIASSPPKLIIGFSDVTSLGCLLWRYGIPWLHAPLLTTVALEPKDTQVHTLAIAAGEARHLQLKGTATIRSGRTEGKLLGGSLSLLSALCGTPWMPDLENSILFLEDVGERPYRLDRMWQQLLLAGALGGIAGVVLGHLTNCDAPDYTGLEVMAELIEATGVPAASGFQFGHEAPNYAVPFGARASFDADARVVTIENEIVLR